ncbi:cytochrome b N-terminal domain-containing protein [Candidatus Magnetominusculus xianensis]|uniref:Cytochrome B6 n=1 Tax=Candidatus Magnetominusculus xianensis TaxID=1748249 RepID=A0ABR5SKG5_9BACT|nr:cytochrome b N-terminal domain-containing protein [Candidatus Magnetominusculus xianensis]KWT87237.1 cytochrome B6 [Candidatus Magnetominusculus xianensis]MBF0405064.1 cytochrome b N-terminal domain-containing protein [Nitrospirota bacterium]
MGKAFDWLDEKFHIRAPHKRFLQRRLPAGLSYFYCLGGAAFTSYLILFISGALLSLYYVPSETEAYESILKIQREVHLGWLIRGMHKWSATLLIVFMLCHMLRVFISRAYKAPKELNWIVGCLTLVMVFASGFTGYLLPWDQKSYWATTVGTSMAATIPVAGRHLMYFIRGGMDVGGATLIRFYSFHVLWLPVTMAALLWAHFHMIKRQGIKGGL